TPAPAQQVVGKKWQPNLRLQTNRYAEEDSGKGVAPALLAGHGYAAKSRRADYNAARRKTGVQRRKCQCDGHKNIGAPVVRFKPNPRRNERQKRPDRTESQTRSNE